MQPLLISQAMEQRMHEMKTRLRHNSKRIEQILGTELNLYQYPLYTKSDLPTGARTIMFLGQTGVGKTTLINNFINYLLQVQWEDPYRYILIKEAANNQSQSMTQQTNITYIKAMNGYPALQIIDTPGFGNAQGVDQDNIITDQIEKIIKEQLDQIDLVCLVLKVELYRHQNDSFVWYRYCKQFSLYVNTFRIT